MNHFTRFLSRIASFLSASFERTAGRLSWEPPRWLRQTGAWCASHRKALALVLGSLVLFVAMSGGVYSWWQKRPRPELVKVSVDAPGYSTLSEGKVVPQPITVCFSRSAAALNLIGKKVVRGVELRPSIPGAWTWLNDRELRFEPAQDWPANTTYTVTLQPSLFGMVRLDTDRPKFTTPPFTASLIALEFYINPKDPAVKQAVGTLTFTHPVDEKELSRMMEWKWPRHVEGFQRAATTEPTIIMGEANRSATIRSLPIQLPHEDTYLTLALNKGLKTAAGEDVFEKRLERNVRIPNLYSLFRFNDVSTSVAQRADGELDQVVLMNSSVGVKAGDLGKAISVCLLPAENPTLHKRDPLRYYAWSGVGEINDEVLRGSQALDVHVNPTEEDAPLMHSIKFLAPENRYLYIKVRSGLTGLGGFVLAKDYETIVPVTPFPKEVRLLHDGAILALSGERKLSVLSRSIRKLEYRIGRIAPKEINHLVSQSSGNFESPVFSTFHFGENNIAEVFTRQVDVAAEPGKASYQSLDFNEYLTDKRTGDHRGLFIVRVSEAPAVLKDGEEESWLSQRSNRWDDRDDANGAISDRRMILVTDLGIVAKQNADSSQDIFVQSIRTGKPVGGAQIEVLGKNGVAVVTARTDGSGHASLPGLKDFKREQTPVAIVVRDGEDLSFMPYGRADRRLNFSRYDISGLELPRPDVLDAFLFSDRGIYRPGDTMHFGISVRQMDWKGNLTGLPLEIVVTNPTGQERTADRIQLPESGFVEWKNVTREAEPTGVYTVGVYLVRDDKRGDLIGTTTVRVEEFLPDRMKIKAMFTSEAGDGWVKPEELRLAVTLQNLYGTPSTGHRISAKMALAPATLSFARYADYAFFDPLLKENAHRDAHEEELTEAKTDDAGHAQLDLNLSRFDQSAYRLTAVVRGFEKEGGRSVASGCETLVSARPWLIGYKADGDLKYITHRSKRLVQLLAVDPALKPFAVTDLKLQLSEQYYVSVLTRKADGNYAYQSVLKEREVKTEMLSLSTSGLIWTVPTGEPGDFIARVLDKDGLRVAVIRFNVVGAGNLTRQLERNAELQAKIAKTEFQPGEEISIAVTAPYTGSGLITIERDRVYAHAWFTAKSLSSVQKIKIPTDFEGNGYLNVAYVRALDSREIFMSPLSYAVIPFRVNREKRTVKVELSVPEKVIPGQELSIQFKSNRTAKIIVYAVDEGILQVAGYTLPDPLGHFLQKRALQVSTDQILDLILPEYSISREVAAAGGDGREDLLAANLNPFKRKGEAPVVFWSGILECDAKARTVTYRVPDYFNGTLRVMAVAVSSGATGAAEKKVFARGPFVIQPNVPTFAAPGDTFDVSVTVANNSEGSGAKAQVELNLETSDSIEVVRRTEQPMAIAEGRDAVAHFTCRARDILGNADLAFTARDSRDVARYTANLSIRPPVAYRTEIKSGRFTGASETVSLSRALYPAYYKGEVSVPMLPLGLSRGLQTFLDHYPNYCSEQITSRIFPMIVLAGEKEFGVSKAQAIESFREIGATLRSRQNDQGGFGLWRADRVEPFHFVSVYVMQMLTEAKDRHYPVMPEMMDNGLEYLKRMAQETPNSLWQARHQALAIYLLTRNGVVATNYLERLHETLERNYPEAWKNDLAAVYCAGAYAQLQNRSEARRVLANFKMGHRLTRNDYDFYSDLGRDGQYLSVLARHFPEKLKEVKLEELQAMIDSIIEGYYSTHAAAYAVLGLQACSGNASLATLTLSARIGTGEFKELPTTGSLSPSASLEVETTEVRLSRQSNGRPLFYQIVQSGFDRTVTTKEIAQGIEVQREYRNAKGDVVTHADLGEELEVHIKIRSLERDVISNVAILDLLPGGFEVVIDSVRDAEGGIVRNEKSLRWEMIPVDHADAREDRVVIYGTAFRTAREFIYRIKAVNPGRFIVPPIQAESMYNRRIVSRGVSGQLTVGENQ